MSFKDDVPLPSWKGRYPLSGKLDISQRIRWLRDRFPELTFSVGALGSRINVTG